MRRFIIALVAGFLAAALSVGAVKADPPQAVVTPVPGATGTAAPAPNPQFYNGYWWYRMPDGRWLYYVNGQWVGQVSPPAQAVYAYPNYAVVPQPYYYPYAYGYGYPYIGGGVFIGGGWGGWGGGWHGGWHRSQSPLTPRPLWQLPVGPRPRLARVRVRTRKPCPPTGRADVALARIGGPWSVHRPH